MLINQVLFQPRFGQESNCTIFLTKTTVLMGFGQSEGKMGKRAYVERVLEESEGWGCSQVALSVTLAAFLRALAWCVSCLHVCK